MFVRQMDSFFRKSSVKENLQTNVIKRKWPQVTTVSHKDRSADKLLNIFHVRLLFTCLIIRNCFHRLKKSFPNSLYPCLFFRLRKNNTFYDCRLINMRSVYEDQLFLLRSVFTLSQRQDGRNYIRETS